MTAVSTHLGMPAFPAAAREALQDTQLRTNLAHATATIRTKRLRAVAEVSNWQELREHAALVKDHTLRNLDRYLVQFEQTATAAGAVVHWANDADEANRIVIDLVRATGADEVVKVKSMATQEIDLNEALQDAGIAAWETDLAELIVQLGHDFPSHFLVPAIHRNRSEIREIFVREMGKVGRPAPDDLTDEPKRLAEAARLHLRQKFLRAKVGISGANFAIAETGTLVVVESEGNGRMCLTLPETLISVVGIEKLLPRFADLATFMQLLPRSSTAERMNPYTSTWTGVTPGDGPQEVHIVLLDNGRTRALADEVGRQALRCIRCSACLNVCPVYERVGGHAYGSVYPGPIGAILNPLAARGSRRARRRAPVRLVAVRRLLRSLPGGHRHPQRADRTAGRGRRRARPGRSGEGRDVARRVGTRRSATPGRCAESEPARAWLRTEGEEVAGSPRWLDPQPCGPGATGRVVPGLVEAHPRGFSRRVRRFRGSSMTARDDILGRVRAAVHGSADVRRPAEPADPLAGTTDEAAVERFVDRIVDYNAGIDRIGPHDIARAVGAACRSHTVGSLLVSDGVPAEWLVGVAESGVRLVPDSADLTAADLDAIDGLLSGCAVAVAETGTIVLDGSAGQGRRVASLVPDVHLCVVAANQLVASVPQAVARLDGTRPATWISGGSATSDIELDRVEGVHGPRTLHVLFVR